MAGIEITHDDVRKIIELIDAAKELEEIEIVSGGFRLYVCREVSKPQAVQLPQRSESVALPEPLAAPDDRISGMTDKRERKSFAEGATVIRSPMLGTFYRAPSPAQPPFVEVGQHVNAEDIVCLIEVMKLFSSIRAGSDGVVTHILAENGSLVEYDQPLIVITPDRKK